MEKIEETNPVALAVGLAVVLGAAFAFVYLFFPPFEAGYYAKRGLTCYVYTGYDGVLEEDCFDVNETREVKEGELHCPYAKKMFCRTWAKYQDVSQ